MGRAHGTGRTIVRTEVSSSGFQATAGASTAPVSGSGAKGGQHDRRVLLGSLSPGSRCRPKRPKRGV